MNLETGPQIAPEGYEQYRAAGGIINETDYANALARAKNIKTINRSVVLQAENMARVAGIVLENPEARPDPRIVLYAAFRMDTNTDPKKESYHSPMTDQRLFAEVLRMLGDTESLKKFIAAHPNIFGKGK